MPNLALIIAQYAYRVESIYTRSYSLLKYTHSLSAQGLKKFNNDFRFYTARTFRRITLENQSDLKIFNNHEFCKQFQQGKNGWKRYLAQEHVYVLSLLDR